MLQVSPVLAGMWDYKGPRKHNACDLILDCKEWTESQNIFEAQRRWTVSQHSGELAGDLFWSEKKSVSKPFLYSSCLGCSPAFFLWSTSYKQRSLSTEHKCSNSPCLSHILYSNQLSFNVSNTPRFYNGLLKNHIFSAVFGSNCMFYWPCLCPASDKTLAGAYLRMHCLVFEKHLH